MDSIIKAIGFQRIKMEFMINQIIILGQNKSISINILNQALKKILIIEKFVILKDLVMDCLKIMI